MTGVGRPYTEKEDARILGELRSGRTAMQVAYTLHGEFDRSWHSIYSRTYLLARREGLPTGRDRRRRTWTTREMKNLVARYEAADARGKRDLAEEFGVTVAALNSIVYKHRKALRGAKPVAVE
jgi:hypothetical protein